MEEKDEGKGGLHEIYVCNQSRFAIARNSNSLLDSLRRLCEIHVVVKKSDQGLVAAH